MSPKGQRKPTNGRGIRTVGLGVEIPRLIAIPHIERHPKVRIFDHSLCGDVLAEAQHDREPFGGFGSNKTSNNYA